MQGMQSLMKNVSPHMHLATFSEPQGGGTGQNTFSVYQMRECNE